MRTTIDPKIQRAAVEALAGRYGGIAVVRPQHRRGARAGRDRPVRAPAAGQHLQDRDARRRAGQQGRQAQRDLPGPERGRRSRASRSRTPTASPAAARCGSPSRTPATASSRRWAPSWAPRSSSRPREKFGFNEDPGLARRGALARSPPRPRSATTSRSARPRSARARCSPRRCRWRSSPPRSAPTACARSPRCSRAPTRSACARPRRRRPHDQELHAHGRDRRHGRRRRAARRQGRGQDRHRRAAHDGQGGAAARGHRPRTQPPPEDDTTDTDAWFVAFAPLRKPRIAVAVLLVGQGAGGDTAAPAAGAGPAEPPLC